MLLYTRYNCGVKCTCSRGLLGLPLDVSEGGVPYSGCKLSLEDVVLMFYE